MTKKKENKFWKGFKFAAKLIYKIGYAATGLTAATIGATTFQPHIAYAGLSMIASALSSAFKDKNFGKLGSVVKNILACNLDKAANDPKVNK